MYIIILPQLLCLLYIVQTLWTIRQKLVPFGSKVGISVNEDSESTVLFLSDPEEMKRVQEEMRNKPSPLSNLLQGRT
jgi:hypothetical protein